MIRRARSGSLWTISLEPAITITSPDAPCLTYATIGSEVIASPCSAGVSFVARVAAWAIPPSAPSPIAATPAATPIDPLRMNSRREKSAILPTFLVIRPHVDRGSEPRRPRRSSLESPCTAPPFGICRTGSRPGYPDALPSLPAGVWITGSSFRRWSPARWVRLSRPTEAPLAIRPWTNRELSSGFEAGRPVLACWTNSCLSSIVARSRDRRDHDRHRSHVHRRSERADDRASSRPRRTEGELPMGNSETRLHRG